MPDMRRGLESRVELLEQQHVELKAALTRVEIEQSRMREVLDSRFRALDKGQDAMLAKFETLSKDIAVMAGDPGMSPSGRLLQERVSGLKDEIEALSATQDEYRKRLASTASKSDVEELTAVANQIKGGALFARYSGVAGVLLALAALALSYLQHAG